MVSSRVPSLFIIQPYDVLHALRKWDGRDVTTEGGRSTERRWLATDREFLEGFSMGPITDHLLGRFAANNNNNIEEKRTGGYSVVRKFWGGLAPWGPRLRDHFEYHVLPIRKRYGENRSVEIVWELVTRLAELKGQSQRGFSNPLGVVVASKMLFFACPEIPIFIYDSVVGAAVSRDKLPIKDYREWWHVCNNLLEGNSSAVSLLPEHRQSEFRNNEEWFTRRSLDLMLYRVGEEVIGKPPI